MPFLAGQGRSIRLQLLGAGLVFVIAGVVALSFAQFDGEFEHNATVTVDAPRAGLVMDPDAKVKLRGVQIGRVLSVDRGGPGGMAELTLAVQPDALALLPANVRVDIASSTVFGAKSVNFTLPQQPSAARLSSGATVEAQSVTVEFNTLFQELVTLLDKLEPDKINAALSAIATAVHGRGEEIGQLLSEADAYLTTMNPTLPTLRQDFDKTADVAGVYADTAPDLLHTMSNASTESDTIVAEQQQLATALQDVLTLNDQTGGVLRDNSAQLATSLQTLRSTVDVLGLYAPALNCSIVALDTFQPLGEAIFGGNQPGVAFDSGFMPAPNPYVYPQDLPEVRASGGPNCWGLPNPALGPNAPHAPYVVTDNAVVPFAPPTQQGIGGPTLFALLFGPQLHPSPPPNAAATPVSHPVAPNHKGAR
jgi:phospholipid/cholesterol/gamma-HCH transport system substrate-binding protein